MGTDKAFVNKGDGDGLGHTAKLSGFGTNTAFMNKGDGKDQSTKGRIEMLSGISCAVLKRFLSYPLTALGPPNVSCTHRHPWIRSRAPCCLSGAEEGLRGIHYPP